MAELTVDELSDLHKDLGDNNDPPAFSDAELQRLYVRMAGNYTATVVLGFDQLLGDAAKLSDYTQNESEEKKSQIPGTLLKLRGLWQAKLDKETAAIVTPSARTSALLSIRPIWRSKSRP